MSLDCDNVCEELRIIAYSKDRQSACSKAEHLSLSKLRDLLKHCGGFCCPTVSTSLVSAGGGVCVAMSSSAPKDKAVIYRSRDGLFVDESDMQATEGVVSAQGTVGPLIGNFTNPFDTQALLIVDCMGYAEVNTYIPHEQQRRAVMFAFSDTLNQSVPLFADPDINRAIRFNNNPSKLFLAVSDLQGSSFEYALGYAEGTAIDSRSGQIQMFLEPGETKTIYGQWFAYFLNGEGGEGKVSVIHGEMIMKSLIFSNAINFG